MTLLIVFIKVSILCKEVRLIPISVLPRRSDFFGLLAYASETVTIFSFVLIVGRPERGASVTEPVSSNLSQIR